MFTSRAKKIISSKTHEIQNVFENILTYNILLTSI